MDCGFRFCLLLPGHLGNTLNEFYRIPRTALQPLQPPHPHQVLNCFTIYKWSGYNVAFRMLSEKWTISTVYTSRSYSSSPACFLSVKAALTAPSNTAFRPFWVKAEPRTKQHAPILELFRFCSTYIGFSFLFSHAKVFGSPQRSM